MGQPLIPGHIYRAQLMVHDGDQTKRAAMLAKPV